MSTEVTTTRPTDPLVEIAALIREGKTDAATVKELVQLHTFVADRAARQAFIDALNECQKELPRVIRNADNNRTNKKYANLDRLQELVTPVTLKHGFSLSWDTGEAPQPELTRVLAILSHRSGHTHVFKGDYAIDGKGAKGGEVMNALQGMVSSHTYAQRDMLRMIFNITIADADKDGESRPVSGQQIVTINGLLSLCEKAGYPVNMLTFLPWALSRKAPAEGEEPLSLADMPDARFEAVVEWLTKRAEFGPAKPVKAGGK